VIGWDGGDHDGASHNLKRIVESIVFPVSTLCKKIAATDLCVAAGCQVPYLASPSIRASYRISWLAWTELGFPAEASDIATLSP
jgi:hypothetical protein